jgi:hypothetical protein
MLHEFGLMLFPAVITSDLLRSVTNSGNFSSTEHIKTRHYTTQKDDKINQCPKLT